MAKTAHTLNSKPWLIALALCVVGASSHLLPHPAGMSTVGAIGMLANFAMFFGRERSGLIGSLAIMIFAPMAAALVQMAISRSREYEADKRGAEICGNPLWLASALQKIERGTRSSVNMAAERKAHLVQ